jgi:GNAT superfamily N-acetyltransferase
VGFVAVSMIEEDAARAGEIVIVAVHPDHQGAGIGAALVQHALDAITAEGVDLAVVATGGDPGHAPARALYERFGFNPLPLVRYYRRL